MTEKAHTQEMITCQPSYKYKVGAGLSYVYTQWSTGDVGPESNFPESSPVCFLLYQLFSNFAKPQHALNDVFC